jgi:predicted phage terminase large subunit-like protein
MEKQVRISREEFQSFLRADFVAFADKAFEELNPGKTFLPNWHIEVIADALQQCFAGKLHRLAINLPPRSLKSHMTSISFPAWVLGHRPEARFICVSYAQDLSEKLASDCRSLIATDWYQALFPGMRSAADRQSVHDFATTERGFRLATSVSDGITGRGADFVIIDDPLKSDEAVSERRRNSVNEWYDSSVFPRLDDKRVDCIILIMQRLHEDDLVGHVLKQGDWELLKFPAIAEEDENYLVETPYGRKRFARRRGEALHPDREPLEVLAQLREVLGEYNFAGQYQQAPSPLGGGMIKRQWFLSYTPQELPKEFELVFQSWDTANKCSELNDYSVCTTWGIANKHLYLLDVFRKRMDYPELRRNVKGHADSWKAKNILIEDRSSGTSLIQDLIADGMHCVTRYQPKVEKVMRMHSVTSTIENGFVHIPEQASWLAEYVHEMAVFPNGRFDDQVDSTSQALDWAKEQRSARLVCEVITVETKHTPFASHSHALERSAWNRTGGWIVISK